MTSRNECFDIGKWHGALIFTSGSFSELKGYMESDAAIRIYLSGLNVVAPDGKGNLIPAPVGSDPLSDAYAEHVESSLSDSLVVHANMLVVTAGAYFENIAFDFLSVFFQCKPKAMHQFVGGDASKGSLNIVEVFDLEDLDSFTAAFSKRAAKKASDGPPQKILDRIQKLSGHGLAAELQDRIVKLVLQRNEIAHELKRYDLDKLDIKSTYDTLEDFLMSLGAIAKNLKMPICDPAGVIV